MAETGSVLSRLRGVLPDLLDAPVFAVDETLALRFVNGAALAYVDPEHRHRIESAFLRDFFDDPAVRFVSDAFEQARKSVTPVDAETPGGPDASHNALFKPGAQFRVLSIPDPDRRNAGLVLFAGASRSKRHATEALQQDKMRLLGMFEMLEDFIFFMTDAAGIMTNLVGQVEAITGFPVEHFLGSFADKLVYKADSERFIGILEAAREGRKGSVENIRLLHRDGHLLNLSVHFAPWRDKDGVIGGANGMAHFHTAVSIQDEPTLAKNLDVVRSVAEGIAGDFNGILSGMSGYVSLLRAQVDRASPLWQPVAHIYDAAQRATELTQQLMATARTGRGTPHPTDVAEILRGTVDKMLAVVDEGVSIRVSAQDGLGPVNADPSHLRQMIANLVRNAWESMPGGGVIETRLEGATLRRGEIAGLRAGDYVILTVRDEGIGIDEADLPRIFDPFFTTKSMSRGLGLSAVHGIVADLHGKATVESKESQGSTFRIYLPVSHGEDRTAARGPGIAGSAVLVVDDETVVRDFCKAAFRSVGAQVETAADGREGLALLAKRPHHFDLVILDIMLPGMKGEEVFHEMRKINPRVKIAFTSGHMAIREDLERKGLMKQAVAFLEKPFDIHKLLALVYDIKNREEPGSAS